MRDERDELLEEIERELPELVSEDEYGREYASHEAAERICAIFARARANGVIRFPRP